MKAIGYIKSGTKVAVKFSQPLQFDRRNRTFETVPAKNFDMGAFT